MKYLYTIAFSVFVFFHLAGQGYDKNYQRVSSGDLTVDKNFYLLAVIDKAPEVKSILSDNALLKGFLQKKLNILKAHVTDTCSLPVTLVSDFIWKDDTAALAKELGQVYLANKKAFDKVIDGHLRPSGYYQRFAGMSNSVLLAKAWNQCFYGMDYIVNQYGLGKRMRYPHIDSVSYVVTSRVYRIVLKDIMASLDEVNAGFDVFYKPSLAVAMQLMQANDRDEPARLEPLEKGINKMAFDQIKKTDWKKYRYAVIVLPGAGPSLSTTPVSPDGKIHCDVAARRYLAGDAPFIIPTGGYCYPFQGPYNEAVEMKKYLMEKYDIPASAIIVEPQARHTTTNIRNSIRLMVRYGIPIDGPSLFVTSMSQTKYSAADAFDARNKRELGYVPYTRKKQLSNHVIEFYPMMESLHMDPYDPLDP
ncbi:YdcF family protein [Chryseolinea sp. T2]|uniref:YdcF family protein n=1 Tax=Chryseolinea sp. T2 TaxID=3129255 RepID=UPI00307813E0